MTSRQSRLRERRKAEGGKRFDVMLTADGLSALAALRNGSWKNKTSSELVEAAVTKCAVDAGLFQLRT